MGPVGSDDTAWGETSATESPAHTDSGTSSAQPADTDSGTSSAQPADTDNGTSTADTDNGTSTADTDSGTDSPADTDTAPPPESPTKLHFYRSRDDAQLTLFWTDRSYDEDGFVIEMRADGGTWRTVGTASKNAEQYAVAAPPWDPKTSTEFRVRAFRGGVYSTRSNIQRVVGTQSVLEVYPVIPGLDDPKDHTIDGITFSELADQCPAEPDQGKATRLSAFFEVTVRPASGGDWRVSPTYEVRPQIRSLLAQNDPALTGGHQPYGYAHYGPNADKPQRTMHSRHWTNFDAETEVVVRIRLRDGALTQSVNLDQTEILPAPLAVTQVDGRTTDVMLPAAHTGSVRHARHFMVAFNRKDWEDPDRGPLVYEHPLMIFVNPVKPAPASAPTGTWREFEDGKLLVLGPGIHLPDNHLRFFGPGENNTAEEVYIPGDAYVHGGFCLNSTEHPIRVWGRGVYSDELFFVFEPEDNWAGRTPWATIPPAEGNAWGIKGKWEANAFLKGDADHPQFLEGLTSISSRMGTVTVRGGNAVVIDHKDVGYAGGLYQEGNTTSRYLGIFAVNDDDITYCHADYLMEYSTTRNFQNGPNFQFGWGIENAAAAGAVVRHHTTLPADKLGTGVGRNHGVFNSRLQVGTLMQHAGGWFEDIHVTGTENIVFNIGVWSDRAGDVVDQVSFFQDKVFKDVVMDNPSRSDNRLRTAHIPESGLTSVVRFLHFDNLVIGGHRVTDIDDGDFFDYNASLDDPTNYAGVLVHTITFFSLSEPAQRPASQSPPIGQTVSLYSEHVDRYLRMDASLPHSLSPVCANAAASDAVGTTFEVVDAGDGIVALRAESGHFVKADAQRYGYVYTEPDTLRGDPEGPKISDAARFVWTGASGGRFALWSVAMQRYVRVEEHSGPDLPLYAASAGVGGAERFVIR